MKNTKTVLILASLLTATASAFAASHAGAPIAKDDAKKDMPAIVATDTANMADGEVRKIDKETKKITLKHGVIKSMDMPAMTMVFQVKDAAMLDNLKAGDKIKFKAEQTGSAITVTEIRLVK